jgi:hypothetical protein
MVALRNQLGKRRTALDLAESRKRQAEADATDQAERERERIRSLQAEKDSQELEFQRALQADQLRMNHELEMAKQEAESLRRLEKTRADALRKVSAQAPDGQETPRKVSGHSADGVRRWADVPPDDYGWLADAPASEIVARYRLSGKDPERQARTWKGYARERIEKEGA